MWPAIGALGGSLVSTLGSVLGGGKAAKAQREANDKNAALQREFAQSGIQWRVEDARKAGVHPIYALGAQTMSAAPSYVGETQMGSAIAEAGQDIGRAVQAGSSAIGRMDTRLAQLGLERAELENDLLRSQIAKTTAQIGPPIPMGVDSFNMPGQGDSGVKTVPMERIASAHAPYLEAGPVTDVGFTRTDGGGLAPVYSADAKTRLEDDWGGMLAWNIRNRLLPSMGFSHDMPKPPKGHAWSFDPISQQYRAVRLGRAF